MRKRNTEKQRVYRDKHYQNNKDYYSRKATQRKILIRDFIRESKNKPCADCGISFPYYVMQFDHVRGEKALNIGNVTSKGLSITKLKKEISKCDVVCANCHAIRTHERAESEREVVKEKKIKLQIEMFIEL